VGKVRQHVRYYYLFIVIIIYSFLKEILFFRPDSSNIIHFLGSTAKVNIIFH